MPVGWIKKTSEIFSRIILNVALPCYMFWNLIMNFNRQKLEELSGGLLVPVISMSINYILAVIVSDILKVKKGRKGIFRSVFFTSNTIFVGLAVNLSLFGAKSTPYVLLYYIANTTFFWTLGNYEISKDGTSGTKVPLFSRQTLKRILSPALAGFIVGIIFVLIGIKVPSFILNSTQYIGGLTTPLAMLFISIVMYSIPLKNIHFNREIVVLIIARFVICPLTIIAVEHFIRLPALMAKVFVIQSAMPAMTSTGVVAKEYGADYEFGTLMVVLTTILSMAAIPVYMMLI